MNSRLISTRIMIFWLLCTFAWFFATQFGVHRMLTVELDTTLARAIIYAPSVLFAFLTLHVVITGQAYSEKLNRMKTDHFVAWVPAALVVGLLPAFLLFFMLRVITGTIAEHLDGQLSGYDVEVEQVTRTSSFKAGCLVEVETKAVEGFDSASFCVVSRAGAAVGPNDLQAAEKIHVVIKSTALGKVVESVRRVS